MNIVLLAENHHNTLGLIWSAGTAGHVVYLVMKKVQVNYVNKSKYVKKVIYIDSDEEALQVVKELCNHIEKPLLVASSEESAALIDAHYEELQCYCYTEGGGKNFAIQRYRTKSEANILAEAVGFKIPRSWNVDYDLRHNLPADLTYPIIVKSDNSGEGWKNALKPCYNETELQMHLQSLSESLFPLQLQQFIEKEYEMLFLGCALDGGKMVYAPVGHRKIRHYPTVYGIGSYSESFFTDEDVKVKNLVNKAQCFMQKINYTGLFSVEFVYSKGQYYYLETNLRNDGTSILSTMCGYNLLDMLCKYFTSESIELSKVQYVPRHYMHFVCDSHHIFRGNVSVCTWLKQLCGAGVYPYFYFRDMKPTIYYFFDLIYHKFER